ISPKLQLDLLRVLQERSFYRVGGSEEITVDVRVIAATNVDLEKAVQEGRFRDDLFYRLNVINIRIPPLRERPEDIPLLVHHFIEDISQELGKEVQEITEEAIKLLLDHSWPGNVRELQNAIERAIITCRSRVLVPDDFSFLRQPSGNGVHTQEFSIPSDMSLDDLERQAIVATLQRTQGNIKEAAAVLGIDRSTLYDRLKKYGIRRP
ncbi:MAG: sigma 54-interacting transcriptional regulator, partial [Bacteroidota bacterium]